MPEHTTNRPLIERRPFPLGKLRKPYAVTCSAAERPRLVTLNRYPGQVIGFTLRLPAYSDWPARLGHPYLSIVWATPSRWWK